MTLQVMFHPSQSNKLLSASVDGLVAVFDLAKGLDEDEGFLVRSKTFNRLLVEVYMPCWYKLNKYWSNLCIASQRTSSL